MSEDAARAGIPFVVAAPSGTGKTTVCRKILERDAGIVFSVSHTTREKREGEVDGRDYFFVDAVEFDRLVETGAFLEHARYNDNHYGTSLAEVARSLSAGRDMLLEIEVQGAGQVRSRRPDARLIFLMPPSLRTLEQRLRDRGTDDEGQIQRRLREASRELAAVTQFDYAVVNDDLDRCVQAVLAIVAGERRRSVVELREKFSPQAAEERLRAAAG